MRERFKMSRREFVKVGAGMAAFGATDPATRAGSVSELSLLSPRASSDLEFYVATAGDDQNPGTESKPFRTLERAQKAVRAATTQARKPVRVLVREGAYYLNKPLTLGPEDSGAPEAPVVYAA
ncbi:MAG TPA: hypothetical protein VFZ08_12155, partial [Terriglobia bacterium]|nr:hypothetical protein [Terriglobia bacterium]